MLWKRQQHQLIPTVNLKIGFPAVCIGQICVLSRIVPQKNQSLIAMHELLALQTITVTPDRSLSDVFEWVQSFRNAKIKFLYYTKLRWNLYGDCKLCLIFEGTHESSC